MESSKGQNNPYILGLDLGTSSIGWCLVEANPKPQEILACGVRIFPEGMDRTRGEKSLNQDRRDARSLRRQTYRRARRKQKLQNALQNAGLLPNDQTKLEKLWQTTEPYNLRARALNEKLEAWQIGRALYHLGQRRGYLSNRKTGKDKEDGKVAESIGELQQAITADGCRTLGEYFSTLKPHETRIRGRYTSRQMYQEEFNKIWEAQAKYYPKEMDIANRKCIHDAIFFQRPLKIQKHLVGECEFEPGRKRAPRAALVSQEFRLWQTLNNLKVLFVDGEERFLTDKERAKLYDKLSTVKQLSWEKIKSVLDFFESAQFNLEKVRKSGLLGNQSAAIVSAAIGKKHWKAMGDKGREQLIYDLLNIDSDDALKNRLRHHYSFEDDRIEKLVKKSLELPKGYLHLSSKAARKITNELKRMATVNNCGLTYDQACKQAGYIHTKPAANGNRNQLPFPGKAAKNKRNKTFNHDPLKIESTVSINSLRNPLVERALYQVRRVVNTIIKQYGKPRIIRVEMARDLKSNRKQREDMIRRQRQNEEANLRAEKALLEFGIPNPTRTDKLKYRLWEECGHICPYTGKNIGFNILFGDHPEFDIEHIIPYTRCLDDSYMNKTLCHRSENDAKGNLTPWEFYHGHEEKYAQALQRAKKLPYPKFKRFAKDALKELDDFVSQQLNETRYISRKAVEYLQQLNGIKIEPVKGGTTALLRRAWGLNGILSNNGDKTRLDHRHHAVDALVCALTDRKAVQKLNRYAALSHGRLRIAGYPEAIPNLRQKTETAIHDVIVAHKPQRKVKGPLHDETLYGMARDENGDAMAVVRMNIGDLNVKDIQGTGRKKIRDPKIRELANAHLKKHSSIKDAFANPDNPFGFITKNGDFRPIKKTRVLTDRSVTPIGKALSRKNGKRRHVWTRNNHHIEIYEIRDNNGNPKWKGNVVSTLEAINRKQQHLPIIQKQLGSGKRFIMALHQNDMVNLDYEGKSVLCRVEKMDQNGNISLRFHTDADKKDWRRAIRKNPETLRQANVRKVEIGILGNILNSYD